MLRLTDELAKTIISKIKNPHVISSGEQIFTFGTTRSIGLIDPMCAIGTEHAYSIECPTAVIYKELPYPPPSVKGYFLYKREELLSPMQPWLIDRYLVDPSIMNHEEKIDVSDCSIMLASDIDKLTCKTISTLEDLLKAEPLIMDCLNLDQK